MEVADNYSKILSEVRSSLIKSGRNEEECTLIAVSKTKPLSMLMEAYEAGARDFGENYVQELTEKIPLMPGDVKWHMIGHLQKNKVKYIVGKVYLIHSVDTIELAETISRESLKKGVISNVLLEINVSGEESKWGTDVSSVLEFVKAAALLPGISVKGFMTVAPYTENPEDNRDVFKRLHQLLVDINSQNIDNICMTELSMGMTGDYKVAVEEGSTYVRVGTGIFGARDYSKK